MRFFRYHGRTAAAKQLAALVRVRVGDLSDTVVVSVPRGGVVVGAELARLLDLPHDIVVSRKIGEERHPEWAMGAVTETGDVVWDVKVARRANPAYRRKELAAQTKEAHRRLKTFRKGLPRRNVRGKTVILADDGVARGWTLRAAIMTLRAEGAARVVVAVPVASREGVRALSRDADDVVAGYVPENFRAVGAYYHRFAQVGDERVIQLLRRHRT